MDFFGDYHNHSRYSDGKERIIDIADAAANQGLCEVAITDHGPNVLGSGVRSIDTYRRIQDYVASLNDPPVRILVGAEANILDLDGTLDIPADLYMNLDVLICGLHPFTMPQSLVKGVKLFGPNYMRFFSGPLRKEALETNTRAVIAALENHPIDILAHPGLFFEVDIDEVARACVRNDVLFEVNCGHHFPDVSRLIAASRAGVDFIVNSDSHFYDTVGVLDYGAEVLELIGVEPERVFNCRTGGGRRWKGKRINLKH